MSYRNPDPNRMSLQSQAIGEFVGHSVTWKCYVSATTGNQAAGIGETYHYRQQAITAVMAFGRDNREPNLQFQMPGGQLLAGEVYAMTEMQLGVRDEIIWNGTAYRVESDTLQERIGNHWNTRLKRGDT